MYPGNIDAGAQNYRAHKEGYIPNYDFESGELMPWQEMSKRLRELAETCSELASIIGAEYSDIKTRLDDLEETIGGLLTPEQEYTVEALKFKSQTGHLPECGCVECEKVLWS